MVAHNPTLPPPRISRDDAVALFRRADQALHAAASRSVEEKFRIAKASGIHIDELERLIGNDPDEHAADAPEASSRRRAAPSVDAEAPLPDGSSMPAAPATLSKHPSVQSAFRRGVHDSFSRVASCPYGENGIAKACAKAWTEGLRIGRAARGVAS